MTVEIPADDDAAVATAAAGGDCAVLVFAKAPVPGEVKTRLIPALGAEGAADLHRRFTRRAVETARRAGVGPVTLCCAPDVSHPFFRRLGEDLEVPLAPQRGADLGARMADALGRTLERQRVAILIGSDCPGLDADYLRRAARLLTGRALSVVLGPAVDGGYVLIGATRLHPSLFERMPWGKAGVLATTRARLRALGWAFTELEPLGDIDRPEDLARMSSLPGRDYGQGRPEGPD